MPYSLYRASVPVQRCTLTLPIPLLPYGPYSLYRASVPVQRCTLPLPIPLLPYVPYGLYWTSVPVKRCTLPLPIPQAPLCAVRPVQSLSACTTVHFTFTYTSTPLCAVRPVQSLSACTTVHFTFTFNHHFQTYNSLPYFGCRMTEIYTWFTKTNKAMGLNKLLLQKQGDKMEHTTMEWDGKGWWETLNQRVGEAANTWRDIDITVEKQRDSAFRRRSLLLLYMTCI